MSLWLTLERSLGPNGALGIVTAFCVLVPVIFYFLIGKKNEKENGKASEPPSRTEEKDVNIVENGKTDGHHRNGRTGSQKHHSRRVQHHSVSKTSPCVAAMFRGHGDTITDFDLSRNGCLLASVSCDRVLFLWTFDDLLQSDKQFSRVNVELDTATLISFSPDSKAFVTTLKSENEIQVWKLSKKLPETNPPKMTAVPFAKYETNSNNTTFVGCCVSNSGRFMTTFSDDSVLKIWSLKGNLLHFIDTRQGVGYGADVSPTGYLVATYGFTSEVRVFEAVFDKNGEFQDLKRAFELGGHTTSVVGVAFDREGKRMVSVSKDGAWRLFNIDVEYRLNQDPKLICKGNIPSEGITSVEALPLCPAISANSVIIGTGHSLYQFDTPNESTGKIERVDDLSGAVQTGTIHRLRLDATGEYALLAIGRAVVVCNLFGELKLRLKEAQRLARGAKGALADRLKLQIASLTEKLSAVAD